MVAALLSVVTCQLSHVFHPETVWVSDRFYVGPTWQPSLLPLEISIVYNTRVMLLHTTQQMTSTNAISCGCAGLSCHHVKPVHESEPPLKRCRSTGGEVCEGAYRHQLATALRVSCRCMERTQGTYTAERCRHLS